MADIVSQRLKGAFGSTDLTLMSIIQGVAMAALAARVSDTADHLTLADWILICDTFLIFVAIWADQPPYAGCAERTPARALWSN